MSATRPGRPRAADPDDVRAIRHDHFTLGLTRREVAKKHFLSYRTICDILRGKYGKPLVLEYSHRPNGVKVLDESGKVLGRVRRARGTRLNDAPVRVEHDPPRAPKYTRVLGPRLPPIDAHERVARATFCIKVLNLDVQDAMNRSGASRNDVYRILRGEHGTRPVFGPVVRKPDGDITQTTDRGTLMYFASEDRLVFVSGDE